MLYIEFFFKFSSHKSETIPISKSKERSTIYLYYRNNNFILMKTNLWAFDAGEIQGLASFIHSSVLLSGNTYEWS